MKLIVNEYSQIQLEHVYNPIKLKNESGEELIISMRDSGFELMYNGRLYEAKNNNIVKEIITDFSKEIPISLCNVTSQEFRCDDGIVLVAEKKECIDNPLPFID